MFPLAQHTPLRSISEQDLNIGSPLGGSYMMDTTLLEHLGLAQSEIKVYFALLKIGTSKKDPLVRESKISSSKVYDVTRKLIEKGLVTVITKNKVKYFTAAPPETLIDLVREKRRELEQKEQELHRLLPDLKNYTKERGAKEIAEMYVGWNGLKSLYGYLFSVLQEGQEDYVIGASFGTDNEKTERFYAKVNRQLKERSIKLNILFGKQSRDYAFRVAEQGGRSYNRVRFLDFDFPAEINIFGEHVAIIILSEEPTALLIQNKLLAQSFLAYFESMWMIAKP